MGRSLTSWLRGETDNPFIQLFRYTIVGGLAFVVDFSTLFILAHFLHFHYLVAAGMAFTLGVATNNWISVVWVFDKRAVKNPLLEFTIFAILGAAGLGINEGVIYLFTGLVGFHYLTSKIISTATTFAWNFISRKLVLFSCPLDQACSNLLTIDPLEANG
jgi:putative flippase GtrA